MNLKYSKIIATGSYLPKRILTNCDLEQIVDTNDQWIVERTGIKERHIAEGVETTSEMGYLAATDALNKAQLNASQIEMIIVATSTPDAIFPSTACLIQNKLRIITKGSFDLQAACSGFVYGLGVGDSFIRSGLAKTVLVIGADTMSRIVDYTDRNTCILFADGAGAAILQASNLPGVIASELRSDGAYNSILTCDGHLYHGKVNGHPYIKMEGAAVFKFAVRSMSALTEEILAKNNFVASDIDLVIAHQANIRILEATARNLNLPMDKMMVTVDRHANTSAASVGLALDAAFSEGRIKPGSLVLFLGVGAGFSWAASLVRF